MWYHRGCASIPPALYKSLSNSNDPFVCLACTNVHLKQEIYQLKNELAGMTDVRDKCTALADEVTALRQLVGSLVKDTKLSSKPNVRPNAAKSKRSYATAVTTSTTVPLPAAAVSRPTAPGRTGPEKSLIARNIASGESNKSRVKVNGARKIWGTVPTCSAGAIAATISKLVPTKLQLRIRRKTKMLSNNKAVWRFIVHGEESDLHILEHDWDKVKVQTLWSLENCYMSPNAAQPESHTSTITSVSIPESVTQPPPNNTCSSEHVPSKQLSPTAVTATAEKPSNSDHESNNVDAVATETIEIPHTSPFRNTPSTPPHT